MLSTLGRVGVLLMAIAAVGCGSSAPSSVASATPDATFGPNDCTAPGQGGAMTQGAITVQVPHGWADETTTGTDNLVLRVGDRSANGNPRVAIFTTTSVVGANLHDAVAHLAQQDQAAGDTVSSVVDCTIAGARSSFYADTRPGKPKNYVFFLVHGGATFEADVVEPPDHVGEAIAKAKSVLGSITFTS